MQRVTQALPAEITLAPNSTTFTKNKTSVLPICPTATDLLVLVLLSHTHCLTATKPPTCSCVSGFGGRRQSFHPDWPRHCHTHWQVKRAVTVLHTHTHTHTATPMLATLYLQTKRGDQVRREQMVVSGQLCIHATITMNWRVGQTDGPCFRARRLTGTAHSRYLVPQVY